MSDADPAARLAEERARFDQVLELRAERLRRSGRREDRHRVVEEIAVLAVGNERVGIPVAGLRELVPCPPIAALPGLPPWLTGVVQIRGELISVVDLARWLDIPSDQVPDRLAVVEGPSGALGLLAHRVLGFRELADEDLADDHVGTSPVAGRLLRGMTNDLVAILDVGRLVADQDLTVDPS